jgi:hypothetical protein
MTLRGMRPSASVKLTVATSCGAHASARKEVKEPAGNRKITFNECIYFFIGVLRETLPS